MIEDRRPTAEERNWAMGCHLASLIIFLGIPFGNLIGPFIIWLLKREEYPMVEEQGKESMNYQLSALIYFIVGCGLAIASAISIIMIPFAVAGLIALILMSIPYVIFIIIAAVKASNGESYRYPLTIRFFN